MRIQFVTFLIVSLLFTSLTAQQEQFTPEKLWQLKRLGGGAVAPNEKWVLYTLTEYTVAENRGTTNYHLLNLEDGTSHTLTLPDQGARALKWTETSAIAYMVAKGSGVEIKSYHPDSKEIKLLRSIPKNTVMDFKLSPELNYLVTVEKVKTKISFQEMYPDLPEANFKVYDDLMYRHWDTWKDEYNSQLLVYPIGEASGKSAGINILEGTTYDGVLKPFGGLENVTFSKSGEELIYSSKKKTGIDYATSTNSELYVYEMLTGDNRLITQGYKGYDTHPLVSPDGKSLAWLSMAKDGFEADKNDIIVRDLSNNEDLNLTRDIDLTVSDYKWSKDGKSIYFLADIHGTKQLFEYDLKKRKHEQLTDGIYNYTGFYETKKEFIAVRQSMLVPSDIYRITKKDGEVEQLTDVNAEILDVLPKPTLEKRWITTSDNKKMLTWVLLPPNFDRRKKYPALLYCQGGPQGAVSQFFSYRWNFRLMASQDYVIIAPNRRGLPGFGQEWNDAISKDWGGQAIEDYLAAVDEVKKEDYVDENRIGAVGASYGGYSVFYLAGIHEGRFKSFISHCGLFNMTSWYGTTEELFFANWEFGGPYWLEANRSIYQRNSPHYNVKKWDTPMLVIQGGKDYRVPEGQSFEAFQALQILGIKSKFLYFPDENHWVLQPQNAMVWQTEYFKWLEETLKK
jgi:dipeptidyl aminopeptidase/acylaminoacyl peptidase